MAMYMLDISYISIYASYLSCISVHIGDPSETQEKTTEDQKASIRTQRSENTENIDRSS